MTGFPQELSQQLHDIGDEHGQEGQDYVIAAVGERLTRSEAFEGRAELGHGLAHYPGEGHGVQGLDSAIMQVEPELLERAPEGRPGNPLAALPTPAQAVWR